MPAFLGRRGDLRAGHVISAIVALVLLGLTLFGTVYPVPAWPYNILPYVFLALLVLGILYFLGLRVFDPERLARIEADIVDVRPDAAR